MTTLAVIVIMWIMAVGILLGRKVNQPPEDPPDIPPGVYITDNPEWGYNYIFEDHTSSGVGYLTRSKAIRAAWAEYQRKNKKGTNA